MRDLITIRGDVGDDMKVAVNDIFIGCGHCLSTREIRGRRDCLAIYVGCTLFTKLTEYRAKNGELHMIGDEDKLFGITLYADFDMEQMSWLVTEVHP
jgi:hypothetical protein